MDVDIGKTIVKSIDEIVIGPKRLTKYEKTRIVAARALQLAMGAPPLIDISSLQNKDPVIIAEKELILGVLPILIKREKPNGEYQLIPLKVLAEVEREKVERLNKIITRHFGEEHSLLQ